MVAPATRALRASCNKCKSECEMSENATHFATERSHGTGYVLLQWSRHCGQRDYQERTRQKRHMEAQMREASQMPNLSPGSGVDEMEEREDGQVGTVGSVK